VSEDYYIAHQILYTKHFFQLRWTPFRRSAYIRQLAAPPVKKTRGQAYEIDKKFFGALIKPKVNTNYHSVFRNVHYQKITIVQLVIKYRMKYKCTNLIVSWIY